MNAYSQRKRTQHPNQLTHTARTTGARMLAALVLLPLLAACATTPGAALRGTVQSLAPTTTEDEE